jgi:hypothetical protein
MPWEIYSEAQGAKPVGGQGGRWEPYVEEPTDANLMLDANRATLTPLEEGYTDFTAPEPYDPVAGLGKATSIGPKPPSRNIPATLWRGVKGLASGLTNLGPMAAQMAMNVESNLEDRGNKGGNLLTMTGLDVVKAVSEEVAEPMVRGYVGSWGDMVKDPKKFFYERPDEFIGNALDAVLTVASGGAWAVTAANRVRVAKNILKQRGVVSGAEAKKLIDWAGEGVDAAKVKEVAAAVPDEARIDFRPTEARGKVAPEYTPSYVPQKAEPVAPVPKAEPVVPKPVAATGAKEPWQMTKAGFEKSGPLVRVVGKDIPGDFFHGTKKSSIGTLSKEKPVGAGHRPTGNTIFDGLVPPEQNEFGADLLLSEPRQPHQALIFGSGKGEAVANIKLRNGSRILDLSDEISRAPRITFGSEKPVVRVFRRPAIIDDMLDWYANKISGGYKERFPNWREKTLPLIDPSSSIFDPSEFASKLGEYGRDRGYDAIRLADETILLNRKSIENVRLATGEELSKARATRTYPGSKTASLFTDKPTGAYSEVHGDAVRKAIAEGKPVPPEVLADYPDLAPTAPAPRPAAPVPKAEPVVPKPVAATGAKEPWQMTKGEFVADYRARESASIAELENQLRSGGYPKSEMTPYGQKALSETEAIKRAAENLERARKNKPDWWYEEDVPASHQKAIKEALAEGKTVPPEVLAEYPGLEIPAPAPVPPTPKRGRAARAKAPAIEASPIVERDIPVVKEAGATKERVFEPRDDFPPEAVADIAADAAGVKPLSLTSGDLGMSIDEFDAMRSSGELIGQRPTMKAYTAGGEISEILNDVAAPQVDRAMSAIRQYAHSPDKVLGRVEAGKKIWDATNRADLDKGNWLRREYDKFKAIVKNDVGEKVLEGDALDTGVFKARDHRMTIGEVLDLAPEKAAELGFLPDELKSLRANRPDAERLNRFFSENFDALLRQWGTKKLGPDKEARLWQIASVERKKPLGVRAYKGLDDAEREVLDLYSRKIKDYVPHLFERKELGDFMSQQLSRVEKRLAHYKPGDKPYARLAKQREELVKSLEKIQTGSKNILYEDLPRRVRMRFFEKRTGGKEYGVSGIKAYRTYLAAMGRKLFDEPAIREALTHYDALPNDLKPYAKWYMRDYMGMNRSPFTGTFNAVRSLMWTKTLGFNPRSAVVNLTQRINTIADSNPLDSARGYARGYTKEGKALFEKSGLGQTVDQALWEGAGTPAKNALEAIRHVAGLMFAKAEQGNLKHAFLTGVEEAERKGLRGDALISAGIAKAQKTQFRYGKVGTPRMLRGAGGAVFQFWSYPIKQLEFLSTIAKENPMKLVAWWGLSEGTKEAAQEFLDTDLSSALGIGINYAELIELLRQIPEGDLKKIAYQFGKVAEGGGIMPYGLGPAVGLAGDIKKAFSGVSPELDDLLEELEPLAFQRYAQSIRAYKEGPNEDGLYTIRDDGEAKYRESIGDLGKRTAFGKPMAETREANALRDSRNKEAIYNSIQTQISNLLADGDEKSVAKANALAKKYNIPISRASVEAAMRRRQLTRSERKKPSRARGRFEEYIER